LCGAREIRKNCNRDNAPTTIGHIEKGLGRKKKMQATKIPQNARFLVDRRKYAGNGGKIWKNEGRSNISTGGVATKGEGAWKGTTCAQKKKPPQHHQTPHENGRRPLRPKKPHTKKQMLPPSQGVCEGGTTKKTSALGGGMQNKNDTFFWLVATVSKKKGLERTKAEGNQS